MSESLETVKHGPAESGVEDLILKRWSPRSFADKPVSSEDLKKIFTAAAWAASSNNEQPWRFFVGRKGDAAYAKIFDALVERNQGWAKTAPVLILSVGKKTFTPNEAPNAYALHDTGAASASLSLEATALGLHTHGMGGFDKDKARASFEVPEAFEMATRKRNPLSEFVFEAWQKPATL